ncbi:IS630 family transposase [Natronococcus sp. A-GB1]|uniref:IS630 family transposase n=1 Tax=Natronococcus sp. A-GB1 TaxID=3037648 RepID=UPI00241F7FE7|nr:IS630 family transposase [Natronococcus sp. A-GB1]MDG5762101.1 IS630 family transposase [Natronococcus sp. A-GB1]
MTRPVGTKEELEARRRRAVAMLELGHSPYEIAELEGVTPWSVYRWKEMYLTEGSDGLSSKPHPGSSPKLPKEDLAALADLAGAGPQAHGFETDRWTLDRIRAVIKTEFGVSVSRTTAWRYMQRIDWSCQKPQRRARERDEAAVEEWLTETVPAIEKKHD